MSTTIPPPEFRAPLTGGTAPAGVPATVPNPTPPLLALAIGSLVTGTVVAQEKPGHFLVRTEQGTIPLDTRAALALGAQVTLQVRTRGTQIHVTITQIDGQPAHLRPPQQQLPPASNGPPGTAGGIEGQSPSPQADRVSLTPGATARLTAAPGPESPGRATLPVGTLDAPARVAQALAQIPPRSGLVVAAPDSGQLRIQTSLGTFGLVTKAAIEPGTTVKILVQSTGPPVLIALEPTAVERSQDAAAQRQIALQSRPGAGPASGQPAAVPGGSGPQRADVLALGQRLRATVHAPAVISATLPNPTTGIAAAATPPLPIGASLDVRVHPANGQPPQAGVPANQAAAQLSALPRSDGGGQRPPPGQALPGQILPGRANPAQTNPAQANPAAVYPGTVTPAGPPGRPDTALVPTQTTGVVVGTSGQGRPLLQTPVGLLSLQLRAPLPIGAQFTVELLSPYQSPLVLGSRPEPIPLTQTWPSLEALLDLLPESAAAASTTAGSAVPAVQVPQPGPKLTSSLLFFLSALTGGDAGSWLQGLLPYRGRESIEGQGRGDLLSRLLQDFTQLGRLTDLAGPDWRFLPIPLYDGHQLQQLRLFLRRRQKRPGDGQEDRPEATRFIVEVQLSQLGDLQLDGLIKQKRFDLMLRTRQAMPPSMRQRITEIFGSANAAAGYQGNVGFQASEDWVPMPLADNLPGSRSLVI